jgi:hypothetical protein
MSSNGRIVQGSRLEVESLLPPLVAVALSILVGRLVVVHATLGIALVVAIPLVVLAVYLSGRLPLLPMILIPVSLLGLALPKSAEIALEVALAAVASWWLLAAFLRHEMPAAALAALCVPLLWLVFLLNANVPDLHTGMLGVRKATLPFVGLALGLLWPGASRKRATRAIPWLLLGAGIANLAIHLGAPSIESGFVRSGDVYTSLFAGVHRMQGLYSGPFHVALLGVFLALFGWQQIVGGALRRGALFLAPGLLLTYFSEVRSAYLVIVAGVILLGVFGRPASPGKWLRVGAQFGLLACVVALVFAFDSPKDTALSSITGLGQEQRALGRLQQWSIAESMVVASPAFGAGPGSAGSTLDQQFSGRLHVTSHDSALTFLVEGGVLGFSLVLLVCVLTFRSARRWLSTPHPGVVAAISLLGMSLTNNIEEAAPICVLLAILVGLRRETVTVPPASPRRNV